MSDEPNVNPVPTLSYYTEEQSAALKMLVRLLLLAGTANAFLTAIFSTAEVFERWPPWAQILGDAILALQVIVALVVAALCLTVMITGRARIAAIVAIGVAIVLDACNYAQSILQNAPATIPNIVENISFFAQDCLLPLLTVVILIRTDMRPSSTRMPPLS